MLKRSFSFFIIVVTLITGSTVTRADENAAALAPKEIRARFHKLLDRPHVSLDARITEKTDGEFVVVAGTFQSDSKERVPFLLYKKASLEGKLPAVIVLHGTGGNKEGERANLKELAQRGFVALAIDARYHGERVPGGAHGAQEYNQAIIRAWKETDDRKREHPFYFDTVYDLWRTVDYLHSRRDVDKKRIGMVGFSMGGIETWLAAATDERIAVVVPAIGVQSFRWSLENEKWQGRANTILTAHEAAAKDLGEPEVNAKVCRALWNRVIPGILDEFDCPNMLRCIAPQPLLILNGEKDPNNPLPGAKIAFAAARTAYRDKHAEKNLKIEVAAGVGHAVTASQHQMWLDWLTEKLKNRNKMQ